MQAAREALRLAAAKCVGALRVGELGFLEPNVNFVARPLSGSRIDNWRRDYPARHRSRSCSTLGRRAVDALSTIDGCCENASGVLRCHRPICAQSPTRHTTLALVATQVESPSSYPMTKPHHVPNEQFIIDRKREPLSRKGAKIRAKKNRGW